MEPTPVGCKHDKAFAKAAQFNVAEKENRLWVTWVEPYVGGGTLYCRMSSSDAIAAQRAIAESQGHTYKSDDEALMDFKAVNWAVETIE